MATEAIRSTWEEAKRQHPGMLLLFRLGDFYETFADDAEVCARTLGLTLIRRGKIAQAGFPHHQLETYLKKLLHAGHRVAVCDQIDADDVPADKTVNRVVTPGAVESPSAFVNHECPKCGAKPGELCRNWKGRNRAPHGGRGKLAPPASAPIADGPRTGTLFGE